MWPLGEVNGARECLVGSEEARRRARSLHDAYRAAGVARRLRVFAPHTAPEPRARTQADVVSMLEADTAVKASMSPFSPLPAIGRPPARRSDDEEALIVGVKKKTLAEIKKQKHAGLADIAFEIDRKRPKYLVRENTYDVIEPVYLRPNRGRKKELSFDRLVSWQAGETARDRDEGAMPRLESIPESSRLLTLRKRDSSFCTRLGRRADEVRKDSSEPVSPEGHRVSSLSELSEIFNSLQVSRGQCRAKVKKENSWF